MVKAKKIEFKLIKNSIVIHNDKKLVEYVTQKNNA